MKKIEKELIVGSLILRLQALRSALEQKDVAKAEAEVENLEKIVNDISFKTDETKRKTAQ